MSAYNPKTCLNCSSSKKPELFLTPPGFKVFICPSCSNGFLYPVPKQIAKYYPETYWQISGLAGLLKQQIYRFFQQRRPKWIRSALKKGASVLDVGSGEAEFAASLPGYKVTSIDFPRSKIKNPEVLKVDFLKWQPNQEFDAVVFWQSLEHIPNPQLYIKKAHQILKKDGLLFVECPRFDSFESILFKPNWYHLDPPRHLFHFSKAGLKSILEKKKFTNIQIYNVFSPEYIYPGFLISLTNSLGIRALDLYLKKKLSWQILLLLLLMPVSFISASLQQILGNSPIMLAVARKK